MWWGKGIPTHIRHAAKYNLGMETEILATAKIIRRDVFTFHKGKWERFPYKHKLSRDAMYTDNRAGRHFDMVLDLWPLSIILTAVLSVQLSAYMTFITICIPDFIMDKSTFFILNIHWCQSVKQTAFITDFNTDKTDGH